MLNKVIVIGRLVADPELKHTQGENVPYCRFRIAINNRYKGKDGEWKDDPTFINVVTWRELSERVVERLSKGERVLVEGELRQNTWETENGEKRSSIEILARRVLPLDYKEVEEEIEEIDDIEF